MTTFGHNSEKRTRSQPWLLDIEDCINLPSEDVAIGSLEESKKGRKMKKLHFRRFFRQTTTTRGGSTAGPQPEHHHRRRDSPTPAAHMCGTANISTHPLIHSQRLIHTILSIEKPRLTSCPLLGNVPKSSQNAPSCAELPQVT